MEGAGNVDLGVHKDLSMSLTRKAALSVAFTVILTLRNLLTAAPGSNERPGAVYVTHVYGTNANGQTPSGC